MSPTNRRLAILGAVLTVVIIASTGWMIVTARNDDLTEYQRRAAELTQVLAEQTSRTLQPIDLTLRAIQQRMVDASGQRPGDESWLTSHATFQQLTEQLQSLPQVDELIIVDADGHLANDTRRYPTPALDMSGQEYFRYLSASDDYGLYVDTPVQAGDNGAWTVHLARRMSTSTGAFAGVAVAAVKIGYLENFYQAVTPPKGAVALLRRDGTIVARYPEPTHRQGSKLPAEVRWHDIVASGGGPYLSRGYLEGMERDRLVSVRPLREFPLVIDYSTPQSAVTAAWRREAVWLVFGGGARTLCVIVLLWLFARQIGRLQQSERSLAQQNYELETGRRHFDAVLNNIIQGVTFFDHGQRLLICNRRYREIYRLTAEQTQPGTLLADILDSRIASNTFVAMSKTDYLARRARSVEAGASFAVVDVLADGRTVARHFQPLSDGGWVVTHEDITDRLQTEANLAFMARHDALTELPNRALFHERTEQAIASVGSGSVCAVLCLDLDRFTVFNDTLGHPIGDALLCAVAGRLVAASRGTDTVARIGGDEFAIVQVALTAPEQAVMLAERIIESFRQPFQINGNRMTVAISIGIAVASSCSVTSETLLKNADIALYIAKSQGRGTYRVFRPGMDERVRDLRVIEMELRNAKLTEDFELYYQPIVDLRTEVVVGFEALVRWNHPVRGRVSPLEFIPIAEETGLIVQIGDWVLLAACQAATTWPADIDVAVNLSPVQFESAHLFDNVQRALTESGLPPTRLVLEITESVLMQQSEDRLLSLHRLSALGIRIALDDFGTGFSSLSYLRSFPFDKIKIDKSFVSDVDTNKDATVIVAAITGLASSFSMMTVAEGVETEQQLATLRELGCNRVQGNLFSRPVRAAQVPEVIRTLCGRRHVPPVAGEGGQVAVN